MDALIAVGTWVLAIACLTGTVLNVKKSKYCFYIWAVANTLWMAYDLYTSLYSRAVLDAVQLILAVWGIIAWNRKPKKCNIQDAHEEKDEEL